MVLAILGFFLSSYALGDNGYYFVTKWGGFGRGPGQFELPVGIDLDNSGNVYVADHGNHRIQVFNTDGVFQTEWGSYGNGDNQFSHPKSVATDSSGYIYIADTYNQRVKKYDSLRNFIGWWGGCDNASHVGSGHWHDPGSSHHPQSGNVNGEFLYLPAIAVCSSGYVYVVDMYNHRIQKFTNSGEYVTKWGSYGSGNVEFITPEGITVDSLGNVYVGDAGNNRVQKFTSEGTFVSKWGSYGVNEGEFNYPTGIATGSMGDIYVNDSHNDRIQKFTNTGEFITTWGSYGSGDGQFNHMHDICVDSYGYVYITDLWNHRVQKFAHNTVPVANAGPDQTVEQESYEGTEVTLDGSGSTDPDSTEGTNDDIVSFDWYEGPTFLGSGETIDYTFQLGEHTVTLVVTDSCGETNNDEVIIVVEDTTAPTIYDVSASPDVLWPPNHRMVEVVVEVDAEDICDPEPFCYILGVSSNEPVNGQGDGNTEPDWEYTDDLLVVLLRAERAGSGDGRIYTIHVECEDASGNITMEDVEVIVPHDRGKEKKK